MTKTSKLLNLDFANDTYHVSFFLIIDLMPAVIPHIFNHITELLIPIGIPTKEAKAEMEMHLVTVKIKITKCSI